MDLSLRLRICSSDDKNYGNLLFKLELRRKWDTGKKPSKLTKLRQYSLSLKPVLSYPILVILVILSKALWKDSLYLWDWFEFSFCPKQDCSWYLHVSTWEFEGWIWRKLSFGELWGEKHQAQPQIRTIFMSVSELIVHGSPFSLK